MASNQPSGTPAPYGRACINCSRAKCKCVLLATGTGCERCKRLSKECRVAPTVRKRRKRSSTPSTTHLEAKLDWLMSAFQKSGATSGLLPEGESISAETQRDAPNRSAPALTQPSTSVSPPSVTEAGYIIHNPPSYDREVSSLIYVPPAMGQQYLDQFRTRNLNYLPFVYIPANVTSDQLRHQYPFFWACIMEVVTCRSPEKGDSFGRITNHIHQRVLVDIAPSMDLLLGMITFVSWVTYAKRPFLNIYAHLLMAVVAELGINQSSPNANSAMHSFKIAIGVKQSPPTPRTLEERRAVLGCFLISSSAALSMARIDAMRWTPHMEESLSVLAETKECPQDELLIAQVKIHLIVDKAYQLRRDGEPLSPPAFYLNALKKELDLVKSQIPPHLQQHRILLMYLYNAEIIINEISIGSPAVPHAPDLHRLDSLYASLQATKGWLDVWLELEGHEYLEASSTIFFQFTRAIVNLYKLTVLEDPAWSQAMVRDTANVLEYLNRNEAILRRCPEYLNFGENGEMNMLEKGLRMVQGMKMNWEPKLMEMWRSNVPGNSAVDSGIIQGDALLPDVMPFSGIDESWMMDFLGSLC